MCNISRWESAFELYLSLFCFELLFFSPYKLVSLMSFLYSCMHDEKKWENVYIHFLTFSRHVQHQQVRERTKLSVVGTHCRHHEAQVDFFSVWFFFISFSSFIATSKTNSHIFFLDKQVFLLDAMRQLPQKINNISRAKEWLVQRPGSKLGHLQLR